MCYSKSLHGPFIIVKWLNLSLKCGNIDVGDRCSWRYMMVTTLRCCLPPIWWNCHYHKVVHRALSTSKPKLLWNGLFWPKVLNPYLKNMTGLTGNYFGEIFTMTLVITLYKSRTESTVCSQQYRILFNTVYTSLSPRSTNTCVRKDQRVIIAKFSFPENA